MVEMAVSKCVVEMAVSKCVVETLDAQAQYLSGKLEDCDIVVERHQ